MKTTKLFALLLSCAIFFISCGGNDPDKPYNQGTETENSTTQDAKSTTPVNRVSASDLIGKWSITSEKRTIDGWWIQFNSDGTFTERFGDTHITDNIGVWNLNGGIIIIKYYEWSATRFWFNFSQIEHSIFITEFDSNSIEFYIPESTSKNDSYFKLSRLSYNDKSYSGNFDLSSGNSFTKSQIVGVWVYVDKTQAKQYTFNSDGTYNYVHKFGFNEYDFVNYNGTYSISGSTIKTTITQRIDITTSGMFKRYSVNQTEDFAVLSFGGDYIIWYTNNTEQKCFKITTGPLHSVDH